MGTIFNRGFMFKYCVGFFRCDRFFSLLCVDGVCARRFKSTSSFGDSFNSLSNKKLKGLTTERGKVGARRWFRSLDDLYPVIRCHTVEPDNLRVFFKNLFFKFLICDKEFCRNSTFSFSYNNMRGGVPVLLKDFKHAMGVQNHSDADVLRHCVPASFTTLDAIKNVCLFFMVAKCRDPTRQGSASHAWAHVCVYFSPDDEVGGLGVSVNPSLFKRKSDIAVVLIPF